MTKINDFKNQKLKKLLIQISENNTEFEIVLNNILKNNISEEQIESKMGFFLYYWNSWKLFQDSKNKKQCQQLINGYRSVLNFQNSQLFLQITRCNHNLDFKDVLNTNYLIDDFDHRLKNEKLKKDLNVHLNNTEIFNYLTWFQELWKTNTPKYPWAFLNGDTKTGKTLFTVLGANTFIVKKNQKVIFIDANNLFVKFNYFKFADKLNSPMFYKKFRTVPLLIIDNFGLETSDISFRDEFLSSVLNYRKTKTLPTVFISNFEFEDLKKRYTYSNLKSEKIKSQSFFNKLNGITKFFIFNKQLKA